MTLPAVTRGNLVVALAAGYVVFCVLYLGSAALALREPAPLAPTALDRAVPFVAASLWIYLSQFLLLPWAFVAARDDTLRTRAFYAMLVATALAALVFVLYPTRVAPGPAPTAGLTALAWQALHLADTPNNAFPSLHAALAAIAGTMLWRSSRRILAVTWPMLIVISTLTTRQHVAWDAAGGVALAAVAWAITAPLIRHERTHPPAHAAGR